MTGLASNRLAELRDEARYHRERYHLYRAKAYGPRATSLSRLRGLEGAFRRAEARLRAAQKGEPEPRADAGGNAAGDR